MREGGVKRGGEEVWRGEGRRCEEGKGGGVERGGEVREGGVN